ANDIGGLLSLNTTILPPARAQVLLDLDDELLRLLEVAALAQPQGLAEPLRMAALLQHRLVADLLAQVVDLVLELLQVGRRRLVARRRHHLLQRRPQLLFFAQLLELHRWPGKSFALRAHLFERA